MLLRLVISLLVLVAAAPARFASAQDTAATQPTAASPPTVPRAGTPALVTPVTLDCSQAIPPVLPDAAMKLAVTLDPSTVWQPRGGEIRFTITGSSGVALDRMGVVACFRWRQGKGEALWMQSPLPLRVVTVAPGAITFGARVPALPDAATWWLGRVFGGAHEEQYAGIWIVPIADFRVLASSPDWGKLDAVLPVGVTSVVFASVISVLLVILGWTAIYWLAALRRIPGTGVVLKIISTRAGYASLSQLQIIMWSFLVGGCAVSVMSLSGNLIDVTSGTLVLLGIPGVATLGSKLQSGTEAQAAPATPALAPPGQVVGIAAAGPPGDGELRLSWSVPTGGGLIDSYTVQYRTGGQQPGDWIVASNTLRSPRFAIVGLQPNTRYEVQVIARNAAGAGAPSAVLAATTAPAPALPAGVPAQIARLASSGSPTDGTTARLEWAPAAGADCYVVQSRPHESDLLWRTEASDVRGTEYTAARLTPNTAHDFRVAARNGKGDGPWSAISSAMTGPRRPRWSDLIVTGNGRETVDVTRVQMLFFTLVIAIFVALKVVSSGAFPDIPSGFLLLMGISNGVYLTAKFVPD